MSDDRPSCLILDANVIIDLIKLGALPRITTMTGISFLVAEEVVSEIGRPSQARVLRATISIGRIHRVRLDSPGSLELFSRLLRVLGKGEAASLAYATENGCAFLSDERGKRFTREVEALLGKGVLIRSENLLATAIQGGYLSFNNIENRLRKLGQNARTRRENDDIKHLKTVVGRVSSILKGRRKA